MKQLKRVDHFIFISNWQNQRTARPTRWQTGGHQGDKQACGSLVPLFKAGISAIAPLPSAFSFSVKQIDVLLSVIIFMTLPSRDDF